MKKTFKETKFGKILAEKLPDAIAIIGDVLPDNGVFGIAKNLIDKAVISKEDKEVLQSAAKEFELTELKLILEDKQSARIREVELAKTGTIDYLMIGTGVTLMLGFLMNIIALTFFEIPPGNKEAVLHAQGIIEGGFIGGMVFYYFGASKQQSKD
jgi:hypothetical protein